MVENGEVNLARIMVCVVDVKTIADRGGEQEKESKRRAGKLETPGKLPGERQAELGWVNGEPVTGAERGPSLNPEGLSLLGKREKGGGL